MKITKRQLRRIIREEKARLVSEAVSVDDLLDADSELSVVIRRMQNFAARAEGWEEAEFIESQLSSLQVIQELIRSAYSKSE